MNPDFPDPESAGEAERLDSWKEIAAYLQRDVSTAKRWEKNEGLPVHRHIHNRMATVYAYPAEIEAWLLERRPDSENGWQEPPAAGSASRSRQWAVATVLLAAVVLVLAPRWVRLTDRSDSDRKVLPKRLLIVPDAEAALMDTGTVDLALSPDASRLVYLAGRGEGRRLVLRRIDEFEGRPLAGTEGASGYPFFSPDGTALGFYSEGSLKRASLIGGSIATICRVEPPWTGGAWSPEGIIVFSAGGSLHRVPSSGGKPVLLAAPDPSRSELRFTCPRFLPDGKTVLFDVARERLPWQVRAISLNGEVQKTVVEAGMNAYYAGSGHLVFQKLRDQEKSLVAAPFDLRNLELQGDSVAVHEVPSGVDYVLAEEGTLAYVPARGPQARFASELLWMDRQGRTGKALEEKPNYDGSRLSPDGSSLATGFFEDGISQIWVYEFDNGLFRQLTFRGSFNAAPVWSPDGKWIVFTSNRDGPKNLYRKPADGSLPARRLTQSESVQFARSWSRDGKSLVFTESSPPARTGRDLWILSTEEETRARAFTATPESEDYAAFSPDGRWVAFTSLRSREDGSFNRQVRVRSFAGSEGERLISTWGPGPHLTTLCWSEDGKELFFQDENKIMVVPVETNGTFQAGRPAVLLELPDRATRLLDVSADGRRFLLVRVIPPQAERSIRVVLNWFEDLKKRVPVSG